LQYEEKLAAVFTAVNMHVTEVHACFVGFESYICPETLRKSCFSCANISCYDNPLGHSLWKTQQKIEKFHQQTVLFLPVGQSAWDIVDVELCLILKHALTELHGFEPQTNYVQGWVILFPRNIIVLFETVMSIQLIAESRTRSDESHVFV
jgi:hypothetical protein